MNPELNRKVFEEFPILETERLRLRRPEMVDAPSLLRMRSDPRTMTYIDKELMVDLSEAEDLIALSSGNFDKGEALNWTIVDRVSGEWIGSMGLWRVIFEHCRAEIGYALLPEHWGKGYASEAMAAILDYGFEEFGLHSVLAEINPANEGSRRVLEKHGFQEEGRLRQSCLWKGKFRDTVLFGLLRE